MGHYRLDIVLPETYVRTGTVDKQSHHTSPDPMLYKDISMKITSPIQAIQPDRTPWPGPRKTYPRGNQPRWRANLYEYCQGGERVCRLGREHAKDTIELSRHCSAQVFFLLRTMNSECQDRYITSSEYSLMVLRSVLGEGRTD